MGMVIQLVLSFVSRTVFIKVLGVTYLGVNGLYTNVLGVLSLAELGIGMAMNYSLYKPVANNDIEVIKSLMRLYKQAYLIITLVVACIGMLIVPFLKFIIKDPGAITVNDLTIYYLIFLFNTVSTYFVAYKYSLINAEQKNYIQTNIQTITTLLTVVMQIFILVFSKNFFLYLFIGAVIGLIQKIWVSMYLNHLYPYLCEKNVRPLTKDERLPIKRNIIALMYAKIGEICVYQSGPIIISSFISVTTVGLISNYTLLITSIGGFINIVFNSAVSGFGNLIVTEKKEKQYFLFKVYRFIAFWMYGFSTVAFVTLLTPFIQLWIGNSMVVDDVVIYLILLNFYIVGHATVVNNIKNAAGVFDSVKYLGIFVAIVNIAVSLLFVRKLGLVSIYLATICSTLIPVFYVPIVIYRDVFATKPLNYYKDSLFYLFPVVLSVVILEYVKRTFFPATTLYGFIILMFLVVVIPNLIFLLYCKNREELAYIKNIVKARLQKK